MCIDELEDWRKLRELESRLKSDTILSRDAHAELAVKDCHSAVCVEKETDEVQAETT